jgi:Fic family protein
MNSLPPEPKIRLDSETFSLINEADKLLYQLDGAINILPENHSIISMLTLLEAFNSNLVDDLQLSMHNLFKLLIQEDTPELRKINNYISSLSLGQKLLRDVSSSSHIIKSIHKELFRDNICESGSFGVFRETQTLVNQYSTSPSNAKYIPPQPQEIPELMHGLENYIASNISYPVVVNAALIHAQFEMIHPFSSGNGLVGRILFQIHLLWKKRLAAPTLQLSAQLHRRRAEYFDRLEDLEKNGGWESWIKFFLHIVIDAAINTISTIKNVSRLEQNDYQRILNKEFVSSASLKFFDLLFNRPIVSLSFVTKELNLNKQTANVVITKFLEEKMLEEITGQQRNRLFAYKNYLDILKA